MPVQREAALIRDQLLTPEVVLNCYQTGEVPGIERNGVLRQTLGVDIMPFYIPFLVSPSIDIKEYSVDLAVK